MSAAVFRNSAPAFWARGLSVIPVERETKRPIGALGNWAGYCNNMPSDSTQRSWLEAFPDHNVGLLTNTEIQPGFAIGAVDVDRDHLVSVARVILGTPPSGKKGKKGATFFVRTAREER